MCVMQAGDDAAAGVQPHSLRNSRNHVSELIHRVRPMMKLPTAIGGTSIRFIRPEAIIVDSAENNLNETGREQ